MRIECFALLIQDLFLRWRPMLARRLYRCDHMTTPVAFSRMPISVNPSHSTPLRYPRTLFNAICAASVLTSRSDVIAKEFGDANAIHNTKADLGGNGGIWHWKAARRPNLIHLTEGIGLEQHAI